ncbi:hypothetical protein LCGC14_1447020 [marine sediment metagenome]|uniref:Uncharacterized protein n=1 Tax=marine sediment metagenome TaxID=412755 RepID=A0A0F9JIX1_9ZZZZ
MAELLVMARDSHSWAFLSISDIEKAEVGCYRKGDIVEIRPDGTPYGDAEGLPDFVVVKVTGVTKEQAIDYMQSWKRVIYVIVLEINLPVYEVRISTPIASVSEFDNLTKEKVKRWLKKQDADILGFGANYVDVKLILRENKTLQEIKQDAISKIESVKRRQWSFTEADVDWAIAQGGVVTISKSVAESKIYSKLSTVDGN